MKKNRLMYVPAFLAATVLVFTTACGGSSSSGNYAVSSEAAYDTGYDGYYDEEDYEEAAEEDVILGASSGGMLEITESAAESAKAEGGANIAQSGEPKASDADGPEAENAEPKEEEPETAAADSGSGASTQRRARKLVTTVSIEAETEQMDSLLALIEAKTAQYGGYAESSNIYVDHYSYGYGYQDDDGYDFRVAVMTLRIPSDRLDDFLEAVSGHVNVKNESRTTRDITLEYVDVESHKKALQAEEESLLRMVSQAENIEEIIYIQSQLTNVRYELERMESQLRSFDNKVDYSTIELDVREVVAYTPTPKEVRGLTVGERITEGFTDNLIRVGNAITDFFVWVIVHIPQLVVLAIVIFAAVKIFGKIRDKRAADGLSREERRKAKQEAREAKRTARLAKKAGKVQQTQQTPPTDNPQ